MAEEQQLRLDLEELRRLESVAKRPRVLSLLSSEIHSLDAKLEKISAAAAKPVVSADQSTVPVTAAAVNYVSLGSFSWEQDNEKVKLGSFQIPSKKGSGQAKLKHILFEANAELENRTFLYLRVSKRLYKI